MVDPTQESPEEFAPTRDHEYQGSHYHDEEPDIVDDAETPHAIKASADQKKRRRPPPRPHYDEE
jgi:hypothetical protein